MQKNFVSEVTLQENLLQECCKVSLLGGGSSFIFIRTAWSKVMALQPGSCFMQVPTDTFFEKACSTTVNNSIALFVI